MEHGAVTSEVPLFCVDSQHASEGRPKQCMGIVSLEYEMFREYAYTETAVITSLRQRKIQLVTFTGTDPRTGNGRRATSMFEDHEIEAIYIIDDTFFKSSSRQCLRA